MKTAGNLIVLGSINADHILNLESFPTPGETVTGSHYQVAFGGKGANQADALLMQLESPLESVLAAAKIAHQHHTTVALNPAPARELPDELLALVDIITPNETEAEKLTGVRVENDDDAAKAAQVLHDKGIRTVLITLGSRGVWASVDGEGRRVPGFSVEAVDTIAAGDTFNGAFITAILEETPLPEAIRFAHAAAAIAVTRKGAQPSVPWREEIEAFLHQQG
ncbi:TPA: bifunctional hydroxymethylpyrimidine kinase/phosphomethylpyrimidine kinase [Salmonella enterica subsp. enterica serovar Concord]|nr:bifunctional hydroxymethylpyrimidine kinase/phosphomethylpyrimidine kinase [Salmonella enterica subsp. enterica serovar Concord]